MICYTICACNISNDCMRDTTHLNSARRKDSTVQKIKKVRLKGKPLAQLNTDIHERDGLERLNSSVLSITK